VTEQGDLLARIDRLLDDAGIVHMVVGSLASSFHGEPRQTLDIDIVIEPDADGVRRFLDLLDHKAFYADAGAAAEALERRTSFNVIERETGWKVDLIMQRDRRFSIAELERRVPARLLGTDTHVASAEDTIVAKLEWAVAGGSERQVRDVAGILRAQGRELDQVYLDGWIGLLGLEHAWHAAVAAADLTADTDDRTA